MIRYVRAVIPAPLRRGRLLRAYGRFFARRSLIRLNTFLFELSLRGLGILNYEDNRVSGESSFLRRLAHTVAAPTVLDIGAHTGDYSDRVMSAMPQASTYAFEPHPYTFQQLKARAAERGYHAINSALSDSVGELRLFDYADSPEGTEHATIYADVINSIHHGEARCFTVQATTIDQFLRSHEIEHVHLLKIDTEGNELRVLRGALGAIERRAIDLIQFEFNEMNVVSRVFFKDIHDLLSGYTLYRLLPEELLPIGSYAPLRCEVFAFQNIVAVREGFHLAASK